MLVPPQIPDRELTAAEVQAMAATVARVREAVAEIVARERRHSQGLIAGDRLSRDGLDAATESLGMPPVSDQEWWDLR